MGLGNCFPSRKPNARPGRYTTFFAKFANPFKSLSSNKVCQYPAHVSEIELTKKSKLSPDGMQKQSIVVLSPIVVIGDIAPKEGVISPESTTSDAATAALETDNPFVDDQDSDSDDSDDHSDSDEDDSETGEDAEEATWAPFCAIPDSSFMALANRHMNKAGEAHHNPFTVEDYKHGSFNHVVILRNSTTKIVVKIPCIGTKDRWDPQHAHILRSEAHTMLHIKHKLPHFPVPTVYAYDEGFDNEIGAPYTMLEFMRGQDSHQIWYDIDENGDADGYKSEHPSAEREQLRLAFLKSLAGHMAELRHLEFDGIGMVYLQDEDPAKAFVGPHHDWDDRGGMSRFYLERPIFANSVKFFEARYKERCTSTNASQGEKFILDCIMQTEAFAASKKNPSDEKESFTLGLWDLDLQNILVNDEGEVTGILDWDKAATVPRPVGFSTVPKFLQADWEPEYEMIETAMISPWTLDRYRKVYASAMKEACGLDADAAKYTEKSAIYAQVLNMIWGDRTVWVTVQAEFIKKLLLEIPYMRRVVNLENFYETLWEEDWKEAKEILRDGICKLLDCSNI
jgi:aminoglycoside phosphotransferase (APT) family kinase protein